jgi:hypothetical protein
MDINRHKIIEESRNDNIYNLKYIYVCVLIMVYKYKYDGMRIIKFFAIIKTNGVW